MIHVYHVHVTSSTILYHLNPQGFGDLRIQDLGSFLTPENFPSLYVIVCNGRSKAIMFKDVPGGMSHFLP